MAVTVVDGTNPGSRVKSVDNAAIIGQVVCNPDGTTIGSSADPIVLTPTPITPHYISAVASSTTEIPIGAIGAGVLILTGTGTLNAVAWPTGVPWNEPNKLAATVTLVLASASTAIIYYGT